MASDGKLHGLSGKTVLHFRVRERLGRGGMGVVYRAEDTRLQREVALKFLPENTNNPLARERFQFEARAASSLNHPNICTIYDVGDYEGQYFIAMELLQGTTLQERIAGRPLPFDSLIEWAVQICDALEAAHAKRITHRDIKPGNIFITQRNHAKVLDFGLAKRSSPPSSEDIAATNAPTESLREEYLSSPGAAIGTVGFMSPEQARGKDIDERSDLFSFGCVLYQMATGRPPFVGETAAVIFEGILRDTPTVPSMFNRLVPAELERIIAKALEKDREIRYQNARDLLVDLKRLRREIQSGSSGRLASDNVTSTPLRSRRLIWSLGAVGIAAVAAIIVVMGVTVPRGDPKITRFSRLTNTPQTKGCPYAAGNLVYFTQNDQLMQLSATGGDPVAIPNSLGRIGVVDISRDGSEVLAVKLSDADENPLWILPVPTGSARRLSNVTGHDGAFSPDASQVAYANQTGLYVVNSDGLNARRVLTASEVVDSPAWSPDGKRIRYRQYPSRTLWEVNLDGTNPHSLFNGAASLCCGSWTSDGRYFVFMSKKESDEGVFAIRESAGWFRSTQQQPVLMTTGGLSGVCGGPSRTGAQMFVTFNQPQAELVRLDSASGEFTTFLGGLSAEQVRFSPDGQWVAYSSYPEGELWRSRPDGSEKLKLTNAVQPLVINWSPDGKRISYVARRPEPKLYIVSLDGGVPEELPMGGAPTLAHAWSADGDSMVLGEWVGKDTAMLRLLDMKTRQTSIMPGSEGMIYPIWSPDGRFIVAYSSSLKAKNGVWLYEVATHRWRKLAIGSDWNYWAWSHDSAYVYYDTNSDAKPAVMRFRVADGKTERIASLEGMRRVEGGFGSWFGLDSSNAPILLRNSGSPQIYALDWDMP